MTNDKHLTIPEPSGQNQPESASAGASNPLPYADSSPESFDAFPPASAWEESELPPELNRDWRVESCLKYSEHEAAYLLRHRVSRKAALLKASSDPLISKALFNEKEILDYIHSLKHRLAGRFPVSLRMFSWESTQYYLRSYIEGATLEELCETGLEKPGLPPEQALDCMIQLTELLDFLHHLEPPLIHRDIKPQNVVVDSFGACHFIDMGISRFYQQNKKGDTFIMGTRNTAPPEQFGFQQTDMRSDLYSLGVLLFYCLTGEYEISDANLEELPEAFRHIIRKATRFDPDSRYQTAGQLMKDLLTLRYGDFLSASESREKRLRRVLAACGTALVLLLAANVLLLSHHLRNTNSSADDSSLLAALQEATGGASSTSANGNEAAVYTFTEPLIEQAVRQTLHLSEDEPVTQKDLNQVTQLHIIGLQIYTEEEDFWFNGTNLWARDEEMRESGLFETQGTISSLEDITHMPSLNTLCLYRQQITDISALADTQLCFLGLGYNPLTDLSPLEGNTSIQTLNLACLPIEDTQVLSTLSGLQSLNISDTNIVSLQGLEQCPLETLNLHGLELEDYTELLAFPGLKTLTLAYLSDSILQDIQGLPVTNLDFAYSYQVSLDDFSVLPALEVLYFSGDNASVLEAEAPELPALKDLTLVWTTVESFAPLQSLEALQVLQIYSASCTGYDGLDLIPGLRHINCTQQQQELIRQQYPDADFDFQG